jgi:hypothetical protein
LRGEGVALSANFVNRDGKSMSRMFSRIFDGHLYYPPWWADGKAAKLAPGELESCVLKPLRRAEALDAPGIAEA